MGALLQSALCSRVWGQALPLLYTGLAGRPDLLQFASMVGHALLSPAGAVAVVAGSAEPRPAATVLQRVPATLLRYFSRARLMAFAIAS